MIGGTDVVSGLFENDEDFVVTAVSECPICGKEEESEKVMSEREFRKGMEFEPDDFYEEGEEDDKVFYMKQNKVCLSCESDHESIFGLEDGEDDVFGSDDEEFRSDDDVF